jgi:hypothetical protein
MCVPRWTSRLLVFTLALAILPAATASAATFNVTTDNDSSSGTCLPASCTLRQAVAAVNAGAGGDTINVPAGLYTLTFGQLQLQKNVSIVGAGPSATVVEGNDLSRVFNVSEPSVVASFTGLAVENGRVTGTSAAQAHGGGILNSGTLTLDNALVRGNTVLPADNTGLIPEGGGIFNSGTLHVTNSVIEDNRATTLPHSGGIPTGAGIANESGQVNLTDSVLSGNVTTNNSGIPEGGGLYSVAMTAHGASVTLTRVLVDGNRAINSGSGGITGGAGIYAFRTDLTIRDSTVAGNKAVGGAITDAGGIQVFREGNFTLERSLVANNVAESSVFTGGAGLYVNGETTEVQLIVNSTITGNRGTSPSGNNGSGIFHFGGARLDVLSSTISGNIVSGGGASDQGGNLWDSGGSGSVLSVRDSIVSGGGGSSGAENCFGSGVQSAGHNIDSLDQCNFHAAGDKVNTNPLLAALTNNGGPTETLALASGSPAIDAGDAACPATDQRGVARPQGSACDIGAFELVPTPPPPPPPPGGVAKLEFLARTVTINLKTGEGAMPVKCLNVATDKCAVALSLSAPKASRRAGRTRQSLASRAVSIGTAAGTIAGGKTGKLKFKVKRKGLAMLRAKKRHKLKVTAVGQSKNNAGQAVAIRQKLTLKAKKAPKKK